MIVSIKDVIARCIARMRTGACATCDNRTLCPAGRWQQAFAVATQEQEEPAKGGGLLAFITAMAQKASRPQPRCFRVEVEEAIAAMLGKGEVSVDRVASQLGMSRQTLYRRLRREGATFQDLLDGKRRRLAIRYLVTERSTAKSAAYRLGFSDPAAFSRAFKRWTGVSPSNFGRA
jgi:AraC-like DNA-binding protein